MTGSQMQTIQEKSVWTEWKYDLNHEARVRQLLFDLYELLPDENVSHFLRDCPARGRWSFVTDDDTGEKRWFWQPPFEQRQWHAVSEIDMDQNMSEEEMLLKEKAQEEITFLSLISYLEEATDYTGRKTEAEVLAIWEDFERARLAGPPI